MTLSDMVIQVVELYAEGVTSLCDRHGLVCSVSVDVRNKDGSLVIKIDARGEHEVEQ